MDRIRLRLHDATIGVHLPHFVEQRHRLAGEPHAGFRQSLGGRIEGGRDRLFQILQRKALRDAEAKPCERQRLERREILAGHHRVRHDHKSFSAIGDAVRQRPDRIERGAQGKRTRGRHPLAARLEANDAAQRRRNAHRAAGVAADGDLGHTVADRDRGARGRATGHARAIARVGRRAEMRIGADGAEREFGHVGLGDDHRTAGAQAPHHRRVGGRRLSLVGEDFGAGARRLAGDIEQILDADDHAVERAERYARFGAGVGRIGSGARGLGVNRQAGFGALPFRIVDAGERQFKPFARGERFHAKFQRVDVCGRGRGGSQGSIAAGRGIRRRQRREPGTPATVLAERFRGEGSRLPLRTPGANLRPWDDGEEQQCPTTNPPCVSSASAKRARRSPRACAMKVSRASPPGTFCFPKPRAKSSSARPT